MKKSYNWLLVAVIFLTTTTAALAQITGTVVDASSNTPIPGVNVGIEGTLIGAVTDFDGNFSLPYEEADGTLIVSYVGFETVKIPLTGEDQLGIIPLTVSEVGLDEVRIIASVAVDRKTPVAVSTITAAEIQTELGNKEFPQLLNDTPGVYATRSGGGYGDAELRLRGFNSENIAVMINGVPVNDMENGRVYWSNWAGLADVTRTMQVQRGLGASRVAVPSIGGTINILTKTTDVKEGGNVFMTTGNDGYQKYGFTLSTGLSENGLAATISASKTTGNGFVDGTEFEGYSYFINISKEINEDHKLSFTAFGAPQYHGQRQNMSPISVYRESDRGIRFNPDWGYRNGEVAHIEDNFYHKPQMSLNHYWDISEKTDLSTALYASFGTGGGGGYDGVNKFNIGTFNNPSEYRFGYLQPINVDKIVAENRERGAAGSETILYNSRNDHSWFGALSTLRTDLTDDIEFVGGADLRYYEGRHFQEVKDLLGGRYWLDEGSNENNPLNIAQVGDKINYHNDGLVLWEGVFAQAEYSNDILSGFISVAASNTSYKRIDYFNYLDSDPLQETDWVNFFGYSVKGGANYNIDDNHNIFANIGYFEKAPFFGSVFLNFENLVNENAENQKIFSAEIGYGYRSEELSGTINLYRTSWQDRTLTPTVREGGETYFANILGIDALHQGVELDFRYRPKALDRLEVKGMVSVGDWTWQNNVTDVQVYDDNQDPVGEPIDVYIEGLKVGDAAQTTMALGGEYETLPNLTLRAEFNYFSDLFASFDPNNRTTQDAGQAWEVPTYSLVDAGLMYEFNFGEFEAILNANVNNVFNTTYIADARDGGESNAATADVWYGFGRTFTIGARINF